MGIGTSLGAYFDTELDHHAGNKYSSVDDNVIDVEPNKKVWGESPSPLTSDINNIDPLVMQSQKNQTVDPNLIYDDLGNIVDYAK